MSLSPLHLETGGVTLDRQGTDSGNHTRSAQSSTTEDGLPSEMLNILSHPHNRHILLTPLGQETPTEVGELTTRVAASDPEILRTVIAGTTGTYKNGEAKS